MTLINRDIEHEKMLIKMLVFDLIGPDKFNRWDILKMVMRSDIFNMKNYLKK